MLIFIVRRVLLAVPTLLVISIVSFVIIHLPPGDFVTTTVADWMAQGEVVSEETQMMLRARYGVDQPVHLQYLKWLRNILRGDLGVSWAWNKPIGTLIAERLPWSLLISSISLLFVYAVAIPVGVLSCSLRPSEAAEGYTHRVAIANSRITAVATTPVDSRAP